MRARTLLAAVAGLGLAHAPLVHADDVARGGKRVAMLPIVVHTADSQPGYLSGGLVEMLSARLERSGEIDVVRVATERGITRAEPARKAAGESGAEFVLFGSFTQFGQGASLDVRCVPLEGDADGEGDRRVFIQSGSVAEIIPQLDELAEKVRRYVLHGEAVAAPGQTNGGPGGLSAADYEDLLYRLDALERTVYDAAPPAAEPAAEPVAEPAAATNGDLEGPQAASAEAEGEGEASVDAEAVR